MNGTHQSFLFLVGLHPYLNEWNKLSANKNILKPKFVLQTSNIYYKLVRNLHGVSLVLEGNSLNILFVYILAKVIKQKLAPCVIEWKLTPLIQWENLFSRQGFHVLRDSQRTMNYVFHILFLSYFFYPKVFSWPCLSVFHFRCSSPGMIPNFSFYLLVVFLLLFLYAFLVWGIAFSLIVLEDGL